MSLVCFDAGFSLEFLRLSRKQSQGFAVQGLQMWDRKRLKFSVMEKMISYPQKEKQEEEIIRFVLVSFLWSWMMSRKKPNRQKERKDWDGGGGGEALRCVFFFFFCNQRCQLLFMSASEPSVLNGERLFMRLCGNAPAPLIQIPPCFCMTMKLRGKRREEGLLKNRIKSVSISSQQILDCSCSSLLLISVVNHETLEFCSQTVVNFHPCSLS